MAATHELLSHGNWTGASLRALIEAALQSHLGKDRHQSGLARPDLTLTPGAASTLGLVFYELATNATKYGSLSADGQVGVDLAGRRVGRAAPGSSSSGSRATARPWTVPSSRASAPTSSPQHRIRAEWDGAGATGQGRPALGADRSLCSATCSSDRDNETGQRRDGSGGQKPQRSCGSWSSRTIFSPPRSCATLLESNGCTVVGPVGRIADGLRLAEQEALDGAILDVNLNGERCFPIAHALRQRGVPFVFLTGYDDAGHHPGRAAAGAPAWQARVRAPAHGGAGRSHLSHGPRRSHRSHP